ncbi:MAG: heparinase II/III family protein [Clostridiales bacterium]|jgi:hypothetical protein|nr:heparinase II/III family protein [Clostridiales bacterium]
MNKRFFFDDKEKIAQYVKTYCGDEMAHIINAADNMANNVILFDLRWDMEQTHVPVAFDGNIDWTHQPEDDPEWTFAVNRMRAWVCMGQAYAVTGDEKYPKAFVRQLCHWVRTIKREDPAAANAWRTIETGIRLENWLKAYQLMKDSHAVTQEVEAIFHGSVAEHAEFIMTVWNSFNLMSNWGILANHGLFLAGCMLPPTPRTAEYVTESLDRLARAAQIQVYPDGVHWEQSPMYHNEVMRCFLDVIIIARRCGVDLPPVILEKTHGMLRASLVAAKPNGHEIMMGDSDDIDQRDLISIGAYLFNDGLLKFGGYPHLDFDSVWALGHDAAMEYEAIVPIEPKGTAHALTDSGNFYSRSDWSPNAAFVHFHCGTLGAGHGHADKLHIDLFYGGEDILIDPGRYTYVPKESRYWYKMPWAHNTVTVDGTDLYACMDSWECKNLSRPVGQKFAERDGYVYMEGAHLGYMEQGVYAGRRLIHIKPDILLLCDTFYVSDDKNRIYRQYFQWNNKGKVMGEGNNWKYFSDKNQARLILKSEHPIKTGLLPGKISRHYNMEEETVRLETQVAAKGFASVFSVIALDGAGDDTPFAVTKEIVRSNFKGIVFDSATIEAVTISKGDMQHTVVIAHKEFASPTDTFTANGCVGFGNVLVFDKTKPDNPGTVLLY